MSVYTAWAREPDGMRRALLGPEAETMRRWLAFLRIAMGVLYIYGFASKVGPGFAGNFLHSVRTAAADNTFFVSKRILEGWVIPNAGSFAWLFLGAQLVVGLLLTVGLGTRLVALFAVLLHVVYLLATLGSSTLTTVANGLFIAALLVMFGTAGGWRWCLDEMIVNRR